jgi:hypothetical protein
MAYKFTNNASATLAGSISSTTTTITLTAGMGAFFPSLVAGDYFYATLIDAANNIEIVLVTARSTDTLTVVRGQDGTSGRSFVAGEKCELRLTAAGITGIETNAKSSLLAAANTWTGSTNTFQNMIANGTVTSAGANASLIVQDRDTNTNSWNWYSTGNVLKLNSGVSGSTGDKLFINADGNMGLGVTPSTWGAAADVIELQGGTFFGNINGAITTHGSNASWNGTQWVYKNAGQATLYYGNSGDGSHIFHRAASGAAGAVISGWTATFLIDSSGNCVAGGSVSGTSDERLKTNWRSLPFGMSEALANVKAGIYDRTDIEATQVGVSAQSLQTVLPEAVIEGADGMLSVAYGNAALVAVIELSKEIVKLRKEIEELRNK